MEVVGVIAAIPGLIEIVQAVTTAVRGLSKRKVAAKAADDLVTQLRDLEDILQDVQRRCKHGGSDRQRLQLLSSSLTELRSDLCSLQDVLQTSKLTKEPSRYLKRALFLSTSLEKTLKESSTRLTAAKASLTLLIVHHQDSVTEELRSISIRELRLKMKDLLRPSGDSFIPNKTQGTCEWIWSHPTFCDWIDNSSIMSNSHISRTLCIYGVKGCGKSVLVKSVAKELNLRGEIALHFSFWAGSEAQRRHLDLLRTLMWQILSHITDDNLEKLSKSLINEPSINEEGLAGAMHSALSMVGSKVYFFIDGIDESAEDWNLYADGCLSTIHDLVKTHTNLRLLTAGREPSMRTLLKGSYLRMEITENLIRDDIRKLVAAELNNPLPIDTSSIRAMIQESLEVKTQVMFLWATLVFKELRRCFSVEEVKQTLKQVPHDLDREYHRLFLQLMARTGGTLNKPSVSMKRARYLISSLLACPEPMFAEDLCYAYAAQVNSSGTIEDDSIPVDGIMDACGDFVGVTDGRYHLIHASVADFLTRPQNEWEGEDLDILYFRVDLNEAQASMCSACFKYVESIDLGYPLTDNGASPLPSRDSFFSYVTKFLPFHYVRALEGGGWGRSQASQFATRQFCGLVEYLLVTAQETFSQGGNIEFLYHWAEFFNAEYYSEVSGLAQAYNIELSRRLYCFGAHDERYQSWQSLAIFLPAFALTQPISQPRPVITSARNDRLPLVMKGTAFSSLPQNFGLSQSLGMQRLSHNLQAISQIFVGFGKMSTDLLVSSVESLSIPMGLLAAQIAELRDDMPLARRLAAISARKTRSKGDIYEVCSLLHFASLRCKDLDDDGSGVEDLLRESIRIVNLLPTQPHVLYLKVQANFWLQFALMRQGEEEEAKIVRRGLERLVGKNREKSGSRLWEYVLCRTQRGTTYRMGLLLLAPLVYYRQNYYRDAADLTAHAMAVFEDSGSKPNPKCRDLFVIRRDALYHTNETEQCLASSRYLLSFLDTNIRNCSRLQDIHIRRETQRVMAMCLATQGDMNEAEKLLCKAADEFSLLRPDEIQDAPQEEICWLVRDLTFVGQYGRAQSIAHKILEIREIAYSDDKEDTTFRKIGPLVCKLREIGSINSDYKKCLHCYLLLMASDRLEGTAAEEGWWREQMSFTLNQSVPSFRGKAILPCLKYVDTYLRLAHGLRKVLPGYQFLERFFLKLGDVQAAELVASEAKLRMSVYHAAKCEREMMRPDYPFVLSGFYMSTFPL